MTPPLPHSPQTLSPLRRHRLQIAHYLRLIASLQAQIDELGNERSQLEAIIAAQALELNAARQHAGKLPESDLISSS